MDKEIKKFEADAKNLDIKLQGDLRDANAIEKKASKLENHIQRKVFELEAERVSKKIDEALN